MKSNWISRTTAILALLCTVGVSGGRSLAASEPAKAAKPASAAGKKSAEDAVIEAKYQALVAKLPPDEQAWERTLQANLGSFYLPIHKRERVKGTPNAWSYVKDDPKLPRVLLIGDSVSRGYTMATREGAGGQGECPSCRRKTAVRPPTDSRNSTSGSAMGSGT